MGGCLTLTIEGVFPDGRPFNLKLEVTGNVTELQRLEGLDIRGAGELLNALGAQFLTPDGWNKAIEL